MLKSIFYEKKFPNQGTYMGLVIAYRPEQCATTAKTSEWERAAPKPRGGGGYPPATLCVRAFSRESLDPPPGTGREPTSQVLTCADLEGTTYRAPKSKRRAPLALSFPIVGVKPYCATSSQNRMRMVAIWAREALPAGFRVPSSMPWMMFSATAQAMAGWA